MARVERRERIVVAEMKVGGADNILAMGCW
jgi:hypothetical protein